MVRALAHREVIGSTSLHGVPPGRAVSIDKAKGYPDHERERVVPSVLTTALVAGMTIAGSPVSAADQSAKMTEVLTIQDTGWSSERSETLALNLGQLLVSRIARAKQLVDRGDLSKAQLAILDAESTADVIVNISPVIRVTDKITDMNNKVLVDDTESFADTLIPINGYVDEMEIFAPKLATATRKK